MPYVVIVGDRGSGKTTVLALLYAAQVKSGSGRTDEFRFHVAFESMDEISGVFQQLMSGSFPDSAAKEGLREVRFHLGYRKPRRGIWSGLRSSGWDSGGSAALEFLLVRNFEDEIARMRAGSSLANAALRDILASDAVLIVVDSGKLAAAEGDPESAPMSAYDANVESLLATIQGARGRGTRKTLHPIFVFSKFDSVDPGALRAAHVNDDPPDPRKAGQRATYAEAILDRNMPRTMAKVRDKGRRGVEFARPSYFFSQVGIEPATTSGRERIRLRRSGGAGWELDYSEDEYVALLRRLHKIAADSSG